jgi:hypothetical protein
LVQLAALTLGAGALMFLLPRYGASTPKAVVTADALPEVGA